MSFLPLIERSCLERLGFHLLPVPHALFSPYPEAQLLKTLNQRVQDSGCGGLMDNPGEIRSWEVSGVVECWLGFWKVVGWVGRRNGSSKL